MSCKLYQKVCFIFVLNILLFIRCSSIKTSTEHYKYIDREIANENWDRAIYVLDSIKEDSYSNKDRVLYWIDYALLNHYASRDSVSLEYFHRAEIAIDELYTKSISKAIGSLFLNDNALDYFGEDYEDIYINMFAALTYYKLGHYEDAVVEVRVLNEKLVVLEDKNRKFVKQGKSSDDNVPEIKINQNKFYTSALARYLSMLVYLREGRVDEALIDRKKIHEAFISQRQLYNFLESPLDNYFKHSKKTIEVSSYLHTYQLSLINFVSLYHSDY